MRKIVVAITGASGAIYPRILFEKLALLSPSSLELGVVMSANAKQVWQTELGGLGLDNIPGRKYEKHDFNAPFASGSAQYDTMIVIPCSMGTLGRIANGLSDDLVTRAADVMLKERRKLILVVREAPYNLMHIKNMELVTMAGGIICPATPSFYSVPKTIDEVAATVVDRVLDLAGIDTTTFRWGSR